MQIYEELKSFSLESGCIRVGLIGGGFMGRGIVEVIENTPGMKVVAVSDIDIEKAELCFKSIHFDNYKEVRSAREAESIDLQGERIVTTKNRIIFEIDQLDFIIEATGKPEIGAEVAFFSMVNGKHTGMLNVETDATVGYYLSMLAERMGVVYTVCSGDEPVAVNDLCGFARTCGFTVVAAGKGKNNPLDVHATPESLKEGASETGLNPKILTEFVDGTKTMVEMCCLANVSGLTVDKRNMHGPHAHLQDLSQIFSKKDQGGILTREGVVDYVIGDVAPGVFAVVRHEGKIANETLKYLKIGGGPNYVLYRPYHLTSLEVPHTVAWACLYGKPTLAASAPPLTEVITFAKRDLMAGEWIDGFGGHTVYGGIERYESAKSGGLLPMGLSEGARLREDVSQGSPILYSQVDLKDSLLLQFRKIQDRMYG